MTAISEEVTQQQLPFIFYKPPLAVEVNFIAGKTQETILNKETKNGFWVSPFGLGEQGFLIQEEYTHSFNLFDDFNEIKIPFYASKHPPQNFVGEDDFKTLVADALTEIKQNNLGKIVVSRVEKMQISQGFDVMEYYKKVCNAHPTAFVYLLSHPAYGTWLGASPELLLSCNDGGGIETMSLAGTKSLEAVDNFSDKEIREQEFVSHHIENVLNDYCQSADFLSAKNAKAGDLIHLKTSYKAQLKNGIHWSEVANKLNPTPAICGTPTKAAFDFIQSHESYDRSLYTGFLGRITKDSVNLFVNIRCMQIFNKEVYFYAGCGIVEGSIPEEEWKETQLKTATLKSLI
ncbi:MAG: chorismate-binding protein [Bacteroidetes bacterium]|nr:chorismate-binding protein [Bacteroidota bacterium]